MRASILIVSKNRKEELSRTLTILDRYIDYEKHEIRVFLDGCKDGSAQLINEFEHIHWLFSDESIGASRARNVLYKTAVGELLFGFDDDAHPLQSNFIEIASDLFKENPSAGILAFKEIKGIFNSDFQIPETLKNQKADFLVNDFIGCGFAVRKKVYDETRGFPAWIDIYGEEVCLAIEVLDKEYDIIYTHKIQVNHRVDNEMRKQTGANYFRFGKQLKNTAYFYMVYYPFPLLLKKIARLYFLNLKKYAFQGRKYFYQFWKAFFINMFNIGKIWRERKPVKMETIATFNNLSKPHY
ncbi:glycosyltransferase family 2 protein [Christiangramia aquimixticola]|uniref:glycosyltransferase family 2 protein n=1 Tax=Christiangramia aquimixticola TaxID=1697558 RepID=UPI003AA8BF81